MICSKIVNFEPNNKSSMIRWVFDLSDTDTSEDQLEISCLDFILPENHRGLFNSEL